MVSMYKRLGNTTQPDDWADIEKTVQQLVDLYEKTFTLFIERRMERSPGEPTRIQLFVLRTISKQGSMTVSDLARALNVSVPTTSQLVNTLADKGWLHLSVNARDRRRRHIGVTDAGSSLLADRLAKRRATLRQMISQLGATDRQQLISLLDRLLTGWQTSFEGSSDNDS